MQAAIASRLDALPATEKSVLQHAAVLGHRFLASSLTEIMESPADEALEALCDVALVEDLEAEEPGLFSFHHQLIRDVAYASLPRAERVALHERVARGIRDEAGERTRSSPRS